MACTYHAGSWGKRIAEIDCKEEGPIGTQGEVVNKDIENNDFLPEPKKLTISQQAIATNGVQNFL